MNGFVFELNGAKKDSLLLKNAEKQLIGEAFCEYSKLQKFQNDKLFFVKENQMVLLDGVIFNKKNLIESSQRENLWSEVYCRLVLEDDDYINKLRGSFCGIVFDMSKMKLEAFTNHSGEKAVYFYHRDDLLIVTSHMELMKEALIHNGQPLQPNIQACQEMLSTGSMLHGNTILKNAYRIMPGCKIIFFDGVLSNIRYHMFHNIPEQELSLEECIDEADRLFRNAVDRIFSKNLEYGYQAEADLSGGLDSRLVTWVAHDLGYKNILNVCYCQKGKIDHMTSRKIAEKLGNQYVFYPMNGGDFFMDVDEMTRKTGGQVFYGVCTGANRTFRLIDTSNIGLAVTGLLGELHNAYWTEGDCHTNPAYINERYTYTPKLSLPEEYKAGYDNYEQMNLYEYSALLFLSSAFARQDLMEVYSPFIDKDYLEFVYKIPLKWRKHYFFTMNWILTKYPDAAKFVWQTKEKPVDKAYYQKIYAPKIMWDCQDYLKRIYNKLCRIFKIHSALTLKREMNPIETWYLRNPKLRKFLNDYYEKYRYIISDDDLKNNIQKCHESRLGMDKIMIVNLLSIMREYFS
nr:hypothetical protein [uncultured Acetatifactor sp.]